MKGILYKDWAIVKRTGWLYLAIVAFMSLATGDSGASFTMFYSIMLPINVIGYDERAKFDRMMSMMPLKRRDLVLDKYLLAYLCMAVTAVCCAARGAVTEGKLMLSATVLMGAAICLLSQGITFPLIFRFGIERGRMIYLASIIVQAGVLGAMNSLGELDTGMVPTYALAFAALGAALAVNAGSIYLSARLYEKRLIA